MSEFILNKAERTYMTPGVKSVNFSEHKTIKLVIGEGGGVSKTLEIKITF